MRTIVRTLLALLAPIALLVACNGQVLLVGGSGDGGESTDGTIGSGSSGGGSGVDAPPGTTCTAASCPSQTGCCTASGCTSGTDPTSCGFAGQTCADCTALGLTCVPALGGQTGGVCGLPDAGTAPDGAIQCGPANCAGCCAANECLPGTASNDCGSHGLACTQCVGETEMCAAQAVGAVCVGRGTGTGSGTSSGCGPGNCAGCCDSNGQCQDSTAIGACGAMGFACEFCLPGQACNSGRCQTTSGCGPANCLGCCQGSTCVEGTDTSACGTGGGACQACSGESCFAVGQKSGGQCANGQGCGAPCGCCSGFWCETGKTSAYCAGDSDGGWDACGTCSGSCATGVCVGTLCNQSNCSGCCMPDGTCWTSGADNTHCGYDGALCFNCGDGYACNQSNPGGAICSVTCSPQNCQGCCVGGICSTGTDPTSCGVGGSLCSQCGSGQSCVDGACLTLTQCGATLCAGCCDSDVCHTGTTDSECGTGGAACQDCASSGESCKAATCAP